MDFITKYIESLYLIIIFGCYLLMWSAKRRSQRIRTGIDPEVLFQDTRPSQHYFGSMLKVMTITIIGLIILHSIGIRDYPGFYRLAVLDTNVMNHFGLVVALLGLGLCLVAQKTMGASWRVGIDLHHHSKLVSNGIFGIIRNPTYTGLFVMCLGIFLILPTFSILAWILVFFVMIEFQVRLEEEHLMSIHNEAYTTYVSGTKRYVPFIY